MSVQLGDVMSNSVWSCIPAARHLPRDVSAWTETLTEERRQEIVAAAEDAGESTDCIHCW